jgi:hypothetical protein
LRGEIGQAQEFTEQSLAVMIANDGGQENWERDNLF